MKAGLYVIYDTVAEEYGEPFMAKNDAVAVRSFHLGLAKADPSVKAEYQLHGIADFDTESGKIDPFDAVLIPTSENEVIENAGK